MKLLLSLLLALPLAAQVQVTKPSATVIGTTGAMVCTATSPGLPNVILKCVNGAETSTYSGPISVTANSATLTFVTSGGGQTWQFTLPTAAGPIAYAVTATPAAGCPAGATCTASGTF